MIVEKTFAVTSTGVGKRDYSKDITFATAPFLRMSQDRAFWDVRYLNLPGLPLWFVYEVPLGFPSDGGLTVFAPKRGFLFYKIHGSVDRYAIVYIAFNRYATLAEYLATTPTEQYAGSYGYGGAELNYSKGIPTKEANIYTVFIAEWSGLVFNWNLVVHALRAGREEL